MVNRTQRSSVLLSVPEAATSQKVEAVSPRSSGHRKIFRRNGGKTVDNSGSGVLQ